MAKNKTQTESRGRGRPASFPNQETISFLATIPVSTREMIRQVAEKRTASSGQRVNMNQVLDTFIQQGYKAAMRSRSRKAS